MRWAGKGEGRQDRPSLHANGWNRPSVAGLLLDLLAELLHVLAQSFHGVARTERGERERGEQQQGNAVLAAAVIVMVATAVMEPGMCLEMQNLAVLAAVPCSTQWAQSMGGKLMHMASPAVAVASSRNIRGVSEAMMRCTRDGVSAMQHDASVHRLQAAW